jgi:hypothetical protein
MQSHHQSNSNASMASHSSAARTPAWVKVFGAICVIGFAVFAASHLVLGGMGHLDHGEMGPDAPPAEHGQHRP